MTACKNCIHECACTSILKNIVAESPVSDTPQAKPACPLFKNKADYISVRDLKTAPGAIPEKEQIASALEILNFYRNCNYNAPSGTQEYSPANAINDILPMLAKITAQIYPEDTP